VNAMVKPKDNVTGPTVPTLQWKSFDRIVQKCRVKVLFENIKEDSLLEVGTGEAHILRLAPAKYKIGLDLDMEYIKRGRESHNIPIVCSDAHKLPIKDNSIECVMVPEVLEHLDAPKKTIAEAKRIAKKKVIITVPNENRIYHSFGEIFNKEKLEDYLSGFKNVRIIPVCRDTFIRRNIWLNRLFGRIIRLLDLDEKFVARYEKSDSKNSVFLIAVCEV